MSKLHLQAHWRMLLGEGNPKKDSLAPEGNDANVLQRRQASRQGFAFARGLGVVPNSKMEPEDPGAEAGFV